MANPSMARVFKKEGYLRLANTLKKSKPEYYPGGNPRDESVNDAKTTQWMTDVLAIADMLADQSSGFDKLQFLSNCGFSSP